VIAPPIALHLEADLALNPDPKPRRSKRAKTSLLETHGAIDLASIMVGVLVIGIVGSVIAATVFAVIPWSQDSAAKDGLRAVATGEGVAKVKEGKYLGDSNSTYKDYVQKSDKIKVETDANGNCYVAVSVSETGNVFWSDNKGADVRAYKPGVSKSDCVDIDAIVNGMTPGDFDPTAAWTVEDSSLRGGINQALGREWDNTDPITLGDAASLNNDNSSAIIGSWAASATSFAGLEKATNVTRLGGDNTTEVDLSNLSDDRGLNNIKTASKLLLGGDKVHARFALPSLVSADSITVMSTATETISFPKLKEISDRNDGWPSIGIFGASALRTIDLPALESFGSGMFANNASLTEVSLPSLKTVRHDLNIQENAVLTTVTIDSAVSGLVGFTSNPVLTSVSMNSLTHSDQVYAEYNGALTSLSFPKLVGASTAGVETRVYIASNPALLSVGFPKLERASNIDIARNPNLTSVGGLKAFEQLTAVDAQFGIYDNPQLSETTSFANVPTVGYANFYSNSEAWAWPETK
jgi:hypothetical protein